MLDLAALRCGISLADYGWKDSITPFTNELSEYMEPCINLNCLSCTLRLMVNAIKKPQGKEHRYDSSLKDDGPFFLKDDAPFLQGLIQLQILPSYRKPMSQERGVKQEYRRTF